MIDPKQTDVGRGVIYQGGHPDDREAGVITSFNDHVVFVRYGRKVQATSREDLTWEFPGTRVLDLHRPDRPAEAPPSPKGQSVE
jgi:hypothetical protein